MIYISLIGLLLVLYILYKYRQKSKVEPIPIHEISLEKTSNNRYRVKIVINEKIYYISTSYPSDGFQEFNIPENISLVRLTHDIYSPTYGIGTDFTEKDLPNLYKIIEYYKKYKTLNVVYDETIERINLINNAVTEEQLTILELVPLLIIAEKAENKEEINNILDSIEILLDKK